ATSYRFAATATARFLGTKVASHHSFRSSHGPDILVSSIERPSEKRDGQPVQDLPSESEGVGGCHLTPERCASERLGRRGRPAQSGRAARTFASGRRRG